MNKTATRFRFGAATASAAALALTLGACSGGGDPLAGETPTESAAAGAPVIIGSADFSESKAVAEIYAGALNAAGIKAETKLGIGTREAYLRAVQDGSIDVVPDYTGNLLTTLDAQATAVSADDINKAIPEVLPEGLAMLNPSEAEDKDALVVTAATAEKYSLKDLNDLGEVCDQLILGGPEEFKTRGYGLPGLAANYNCTPKEFAVYSDYGGPLTQKALLEDTVQIASFFTTNPAITDNGLVMLEDPKNNFIAQQVFPLVRESKIDDAAESVLNDVSSRLTTEDLVNLNRAIDGEQKLEPSEAAADWLEGEGLLK